MQREQVRMRRDLLMMLVDWWLMRVGMVRAQQESGIFIGIDAFERKLGREPNRLSYNFSYMRCSQKVRI